MRRVAPAWRVLLLIAFCAGITRADEPRPAPLARYFPKRDLVAYVEFDGIDAHAEAWKQTAASKIFNETPTGAMLTKVAMQLLEAALTPGPTEIPTADEVSTIVEQLTRSGFALAINRKADDPAAEPSCVALVLRGAGKGPLLATMKKVLVSNGLPLGQTSTIDKPGGRKMAVIGPPEGPCVGWWVEKDDLVFSILKARYADTIIATLEGKEPNAIDQPIRRELAGTRDGFEPVGLAFLDTTALPEMPPEAAMFGLDGIKRLDIQWGYQGEALTSISRIIAPSPRKGVLAMFDQPTFDIKSLPPLPDGVGAFTVVSIDLVKIHDQLAAFVKAANPQGPDFFAQAAEEFQKSTGRRLREDFLARLGPRMVFADVPARIFVTSNLLDNFAQSMARVPRTSLLIELNDRANFLKDLEVLASWINKQVPIPKDPKARASRPGFPLVRRLKTAEVGYELALSPTYVPLPAGYRPSIVIGDRFAAIGTSPDVARQALKRNSDLGAPLARAFENLPHDMTILSVSDTKNSALPEVLANVPSMIQWWSLMLQGNNANSILNLLMMADQGVSIASVGVPIPEGVTLIRTPGPPVILEPPSSPNGIQVSVSVPAPTTPEVVQTPKPVPPQVPGEAAAPPTVAPPTVMPSPSSPPIVPQAVVVRQGPAEANVELPFTLRLDPDEIPSPADIRNYLFPATYTMAVDPQGFRITTREAFPSWNPISLAPLGIALAFTEFQEWRVTQANERSSVNLRQIGVALQQYHDKNNKFPAASISDKDGKPLLSWRVELLPFLGQQALYDEFHRNEPWDSPHNKTLLDRMPAAFAHPDIQPGSSLTTYRGLIGKGAFFDTEAKDGIAIADITDGTSNTACIVEAKEAVPWTKPGTELAIDQPELLALLGGSVPGKIPTLFVDGTVKFLKVSINLVMLRAILTRNGGEVISSDAF